MKKTFKVTLPGGKISFLRLGYLTYSKNRTIYYQCMSMYEVYSRFPEALEIKQIDNIKVLLNSILFTGNNSDFIK